MKREAHLIVVENRHLSLEETDQGLFSVSVYEVHLTPMVPLEGHKTPRFYHWRRYYDSEAEAVQKFTSASPTMEAASSALREGGFH